MASSNIEWTKYTWNPVVGCTKVSPGCANCYAEVMSGRLAAMADAEVDKGKPPSPRKQNYTRVVRYKDGYPLQQWNNQVVTVPEALAEPLRWKKPRRIFVCSMSDLFHKDVPFDFIDQVFAVMALTPQHTYQVLTKRPERMAEYMAYAHGKPRTAGGPDYPMIVREPRYYWQIERWLDEGAGGFFKTQPAWDRAHKRAGEVAMTWPLPNLWLGTSVENQAAADERIPHLLRCPAAVRFLSCEPLLGAIRFANVPGFNLCGSAGQELLRNLWVIAGGESGHGARPCNIDWIRSLVNQCKAAGVPCFVKQLGQFPLYPFAECNHRGRVTVGIGWNGNPAPTEPPSHLMVKLIDKKGGDPAEWPADLRVREFPNHVALVGKKVGDA